MRQSLIALTVAIITIAHPLSAGSPLPDRRIAITADIDFPGQDLSPVFDTTLETCARICLTDSACKAFTYNHKSKACFPKSGVGDTEPYQGAISARVYETEPSILANAEERAGELSFLSNADLSNARDLAQGLATRHYAGEWTLEQLMGSATAAKLAGNPVSAFRLTGAALTLADTGDLWLDYAGLALGIAQADANQRRAMQLIALRGAINGYLRAETANARATAAFDLANALEVNGLGRDMIAALRLSLANANRPETTRALDDALGKYGFRVTEHQVESDTAAPRICAVFSEDLAVAGVDYTPFVQLDQANLAVTAEGRQLCIDGVEHGQRYRVTLRSGLPAANGEILRAPVDLTLYVRDRTPEVRFPGQTYVLAKSQGASVPIVTVNTSEVDLILRRVSDANLIRSLQAGVLGRPLAAWERQNFNDTVTEEVWRGTGEVALSLNQDTTTRLPLGPEIASMAAGTYVLEASVKGSSNQREATATQWFVLTDLGITTLSGANGLDVIVRSLGDASAKAGVPVELISTSNRSLFTVTTDQQGYAHFPAGYTRGTGGAAPAMVIARDGDTDMAFLSLATPAHDLSDRGVEGRTAAQPLDVFIATDRGAYRPGEAIMLTTLLRDSTANAIDDIPLTVILTRADGVEHSRHVLTQTRAGGSVTTLPIGATVPRGTWRLAVFADVDAPALAQTTVLVEDFLPERIEMTVSLPDTLRTGASISATAQVDYLFGAPGADLEIEGDALLRAVRTHPTATGYLFGRHDQFLPAGGAPLTAQRTDAKGTARLNITLPELDAQLASLPKTVTLTARVSDGSARPIERVTTADILPMTPMIGIRPLHDGELPEGATASFDVIALNATDLPIKWTVNRIERRYQWYQSNGRWTWDPVTTRKRISTGEALLSDVAQRVSADLTWGEFELVVEHIGTPYVASSVTVSAGWFAPEGQADTPDVLDVSLDQPRYQIGETAKLRLVPRTAGIALVSVMSNRLIDMQIVEVGDAPTEIALPVTEEWGAGAYVTAQFIRPLSAQAGRTPVRAIGLTHAAVDPGAKALSATLIAPQESAPRQQLIAKLAVDGAAGDTIYASIAAIDVGILNLTSFEAPDPQAHYFGQRRLGVELRDLYGRLIDGSIGALGQMRSGGDAGAQMRANAPPPTEELVALHSGLMVLDENGEAALSFDMPSFNGTVRLMAVVWSASGVGQAQQDVLVRDPIVANVSLPRFLTPGDTADMLVELTHATGPTGRIGIDLVADGPLRLGNFPSGAPVFNGEKVAIHVPITALEPGLARLRLRITTPDLQVLTKDLSLQVQITDPEESHIARVTINPDEMLTIDDNMLGGLRSESASATFSAAALARFDVPGLLNQLDRYPYGCTEQITSAALPLLYFGKVQEALGLTAERSVDERIKDAITQVLGRQTSSGGFGLWHAENSNPWLDAFVTDFLSRAKTAGHPVPDRALQSALQNLRNQVNYTADFDNGGEALAYALMVLAREGAAAIGDLRYYADVKAQAFATPLAQAQLAAALASYGDQTRADRLFNIAFNNAVGPASSRVTQIRVDFGSARRDASGVLALALAAGSTAINPQELAARVQPTSTQLSTQESAWLLMAASAWAADPGSISAQLNGQPMAPPFARALDAAALRQGVTLRNTSDQPLPLNVTVFGIPEIPTGPTANGYRIERLYFTMEGAPITLDTVQQGTRLVTVLKVTPLGPQNGRLMVDAALPAGMEIDNPNLLRSGDIGALDWLDLKDIAEHTEARSDRFLAAVDLRSDDPFQLAFIMRAVTPGTFHRPAALVQDMYRPEYRATTDAGRMTVTR